MTTDTEGQTIRSTDAIRELTRLYGPAPLSARSFHNKILNAEIPAVRGADGKFTISRADLPVIAETIGMTAKRVAA